MLFLPKYGTICVCAAAALARPATSTAARSATDDRRTGSGTRVRMGKYLGEKSNARRKTGAILLLRLAPCKRHARQFHLWSDACCPLATAAATPLGDTFIISGIHGGSQGFTRGVASLRGRGAGVARQPVPRRAAADPCAGRC